MSGTANAEHPDPMEAYGIIRHELESYKDDFSDRPELIVLTKMDLPDVKDKIKEAQKIFKKMGKKVITISAASSEGIEPLLRETARLI